MLYSHNSKMFRNHRGFTMIELLVVITIIAMMISLLLPALSRARGIAQRVQCATNLRSIGQAIQIYAANNENQYPCNSSMAKSGFAIPFLSMTNGQQQSSHRAG